MKRINERIRDLREKLQMSQIELANKTGLTQAAISAIELGETKSPSVDNARAIARALGVSIEDIFPVEGTETKTVQEAPCR